MAEREEEASAVAEVLMENRGLRCPTCRVIHRANEYPEDQNTCPDCGEGPVQHVYIECWYPIDE